PRAWRPRADPSRGATTPARAPWVAAARPARAVRAGRRGPAPPRRPAQSAACWSLARAPRPPRRRALCWAPRCTATASRRPAWTQRRLDAWAPSRRRPSPTRGRSARGSLRARRRRASGTATASSIRALSWRGRSPRGPRAELRRAAEGPTMPPRCPSRWGRRTAPHRRCIGADASPTHRRCIDDAGRSSLAKCARSSPVECPARPPARARRSRSAGADAALFIYGLEAVFFANSASSWGGHRSGSGITVGPWYEIEVGSARAPSCSLRARGMLLCIPGRAPSDVLCALARGGSRVLSSSSSSLLLV
ncbi:unnamed protein product, partial [Prorocentrum cordatum]